MQGSVPELVQRSGTSGPKGWRDAVLPDPARKRLEGLGDAEVQ